MCAGDDKNCPDFELHHRKFKETLDSERRSFLRSSFAAAGDVAVVVSVDGAGGRHRDRPPRPPAGRELGGRRPLHRPVKDQLCQ